MQKIQVSEAPINKSLAYCELAKRPDLMLFTLVHKDVTFMEQKAVFSPRFSSLIGMKKDGGSLTIGIPNEIWPVFKLLRWESFHLSGHFLYLYYTITLRHRTETKTFIKRKESVAEIPHQLCCCFPMKKSFVDSTSSAWSLHISPLNSNTQNMADTITITKLSVEK